MNNIPGAGFCSDFHRNRFQIDWLRFSFLAPGFFLQITTNHYKSQNLNIMQGKTKQNYETAARGWMTAVIILFIIAVLLLICYSGKAQKTGYLVAVTSHTEGLQITKTRQLTEVYALSEIHFPGNCVDFGQELRHSVYYIIENQHKGFFVEVKKINKKGKYKRLNHKEVKKWQSSLSSLSSQL